MAFVYDEMLLEVLSVALVSGGEGYGGAVVPASTPRFLV